MSFVDDFGVKYFSRDDAQHLLNALGKDYKYTVDWKGSHFCGYQFDWHYSDGFVDLSVPTYIPNLLKKLNHKKIKDQHSPHEFIAVNYGSTQRQLAMQPDTSPLLSSKEASFVPSVVGSLLYYRRVLDASILPALNTIAT